MRKTLLVCLFSVTYLLGSMLFAAPALADVTASPTSLNFGSITVNTASNGATFVVTNTSRKTVSVTSVSSTLPQFAVSGAVLPLVLAQNASASFRVVFQPNAVQAYNGAIVVSTDWHKFASVTLAVAGTGTAAPAPSPTPSPTYSLTASASSLNFSNALVGTTASQPVLLTNAGTGNLSISQVAVAGTGFTVSGFAGTTALAPGQSLSLAVNFAPSATGTVTGSMSVVSNATNSPLTIPLSGAGVQPQISLTPASVSFGSVTVGVTNSQTVTIRNTGTANLNVMQAVLAGSGFGMSGLTLPLTIPPAGSSTFTVSFTPAAASSATGNLTITNNTPNSPLVMALAGTGIAQTLQLNVSPSSLSFATVNTGTTSSKSVTLTNAGNSSLSVSQVTVTGTGFSFTGLTLPLTLSAGQSTTFSVAFAPVSAGSVSGTATITSNATNSPASIVLSGLGATPASHSVGLTWVPGSSVASGFHVYRAGRSGGPYTQLNSALQPSTSYTDSTVVSGQSYYYVVTETDSSGVESGYSSEAPAVIP